MKNITLAGSFPWTDEQKTRLHLLGNIKTVTNYSTSKEWLDAVSGSDVILSDGDFLLKNLENLTNVFVTYPYIELGAFDSEKLKSKGVLVANTKGSNRDSIVEWVLFTTLALFRKFPDYLKTRESKPFTLTQSLAGKKVLIVGKGSIGSRIGEVCTAFNMDVDFFARGEILREKASSADLIINALNCNSSSENLLDEDFFMSLKPGSFFVSFVRPYTYNLAGVLKSLDANILAGAGIDCDPETPYDTTNAFYQKCLQHEKVLVTPHVAFATKEASANGREIALQNIEAYIAGTPKNLISKV